LDIGWGEVPSDPGFRWKTKPKKLRLYAAASVPKIIVDEIRNRGADIRVTHGHEGGARRRPDT
jgi:hypothetical protein